jgi:hypothetical protein
LLGFDGHTYSRDAPNPIDGDIGWFRTKYGIRRREPKKVSDLNHFCEERDLMVDIRGDGSLRSQQTRLGSALTAKRDRVFNGLTVKRITQGEHKHGVRYALIPAKSGNQPDGRSHLQPDLLDFTEEGNLGEP